MVDVVKIGTNVNDGTGDDLRTAFQKVNAKFTELDAKGGETNTASNLGTAVAGEGVFASKNAFDLQFKRIKSADQNKLSITSDGTSIILDNTAVDNPAIRTVQFSNDPNNVNNSITTSVGNESVGLVGGSNISLTASGTRNILITGSFTLDQDSTPELGGNLALQGNNIIGPGDITSITNVNSTNANITDLTVGNSLQVSGLSTLANNLTMSGASNIVMGTGALLGNVTGNLTGLIFGGLGSDLATNGYAIEGGHQFKLRRGDPAQNVLADAIADGDFYVQLDEVSPTAAFRLKLQANDTIENFFTIESHTTQAQTNNGMGVGINFAIGNSTGPGTSVGAIAGVRETAEINKIGIQPQDPLRSGGADAQPVAQFFSNNEILLLNGEGQIKITEGKIEAFGTSNTNLTLDADGTGYVNFYGAYSLPRSIGNAGQVLKVPTSGSVLEWGVGGGGGGQPEAISGITQANPGVVTTSNAHGLSDGQAVTLTDVVGMTEVNGNEYYADVLTSTTFALYSDDALSTTVNTSAFTAYVSGGFATGEASGTGSVDFVGLTDTPSSYAGAAGDADKLVQVNAAGNGLEFTGIDSIVDATYIEGKGFLPKSGGTLTGAIATQNINPDGVLARDIASPGLKFNNVYANFFHGQHIGIVTGDVTGNLTGNVSGDVTGDVTGNITSSGTSTFQNITLNGTLNAASGTINANVNGNVTGNVTGNLTGNTTGVHNGNVNATSGTSVFNIVNASTISSTGSITGNSLVGNVTSTGDSTFNNILVSGNISNGSGDISINDNTNVTGTLTVSGLTTINNKLDVNGQVDIGDIRIDGTNIETTASNTNLRISANGTGNIELEGDIRLNGKIAFSNTNELTIGSTQTPSGISTDTTATFITTSDFTSPSAGLAFGTLGAGTSEGQIKILKLKSRGRYSLDGVSFFDRYFQVTLTINGAQSTINIGEGTNNETGAVTLIWHSNSWWIVSEYIQS